MIITRVTCKYVFAHHVWTLVKPFVTYCKVLRSILLFQFESMGVKENGLEYTGFCMGGCLKCTKEIGLCDNPFLADN